jgi:hemerythrin-like domain-containing protein
MLVSIRRREADAAPGDVVDALLDCHARIRHFTATATALAGAAGAPSAEIASAAAGVIRYFTEALPLHSADEDASIAPRLRARAPEPVCAALDAMTRQHGEIDRTLAEALPRWTEVAADPTCLPAHAALLRDLAARLVTQWDEHLGLEEATIFPAIRAHLPEEERAQIQAEMRARRAK